MTRSDRLSLDSARGLVLRLWRKYDRKPGANADLEMGSFYLWLESRHPDALSFSSPAPSWEVVSAWLTHDRKVRSAIQRAARL